jgi:hypothetical protein
LKCSERYVECSPLDGTCWLNIGDSYKPAGKGSTKAGFNERYFGKKFESDKQSAAENHLDRSKFKADVKEKELVGSTLATSPCFYLMMVGIYAKILSGLSLT